MPVLPDHSHWSRAVAWSVRPRPLSGHCRAAVVVVVDYYSVVWCLNRRRCLLCALPLKHQTTSAVWCSNIKQRYNRQQQQQQVHGNDRPLSGRGQTDHVTALDQWEWLGRTGIITLLLSFNADSLAYTVPNRHENSLILYSFQYVLILKNNDDFCQMHALL